MADGVVQSRQPLPLVEERSDQDVDEQVDGAKGRHLAQRCPEAGQVDGLLHVQGRGGGEQLVWRGEEGTGREARQRLVADDRTVMEANDGLQRGRYGSDGEKLGELGAELRIGAHRRPRRESPDACPALGLPGSRQHCRCRLEGGHQPLERFRSPRVDDGDHPVVNHGRNAHDMDGGGEAGEHASRILFHREALEALDPAHRAHERPAQPHRVAQPRHAIDRDPDPHETSARGKQALRAGAPWSAGRDQHGLVSRDGAHRYGDAQTNQRSHHLAGRLLRAVDAGQAVSEVREDAQLLADCWYPHR